MQQHSIANNYPGLMDGIVPTASFAEHAYATSQLTWTNEQRKAVNGHSVYNYCTNTQTSYPNLKAGTNFNKNFASHITRARLIAANGHANNQVFHTYANGMDVQTFQSDNLDEMDRWLTNIANDTAPARTPLEKVVRNKPAGTMDTCYTATEKITDAARCREMFPVATNPRVAAGGPMSSDRLKCERTPLDRKDYKQPWLSYPNAGTSLSLERRRGTN